MAWRRVARNVPSRITFRLDSASGVPTYLQLVHQVEQALQLGYLSLGDQLPRVKDVVGSLAINPNTVLKAYRELEHRGIAAGRPGQGTFVQAAPEVVPLAELTGLRRELLSWLRAADARPDPDGMTALFASALQDFHERRAAAGAPRGGTTEPARRGAQERMSVVEAAGLGKRYRRAWALRDCTLSIPPGRVAALVGPNGARQDDADEPGGRPGQPDRGPGDGTRRAGGWLAGGAGPDGVRGPGRAAVQEPAGRRHDAAGQKPEPAVDQPRADKRLAALQIPPGRKIGKLSGGQQAQVALTIALARRPDLLVLDEPLAPLDPLARHEFLASVMETVAEDGTSVFFSSHVILELERVADYLIVLSGGRVQVAGDVEQLLASHQILSRPPPWTP